MIRRIRPSLRWFAVAAALLLVALPVQADEIEPEPYVEEEVEPEPEPEVEAEVEVEIEDQGNTAADDPMELYDFFVLRPINFAAATLGMAFFVPAAVLASASGTYGIAEAWEIFVVEPMKYTFTRPLGEF